MVKDDNTKGGPGETADKKDKPHPEINGFSSKMRKHAGKRRCNNLVGFGGNSDSGRNADEEQEGRHKKPPADTKHARKDPDQPAKS
ncbi:hypothetical protein NBRC116597_16030 [Phaeobacter sp. NW0010-22]